MYTYFRFKFIRARNTICATAFILIFSCDKFVDVGSPKTQLINSTVFSNDEIATSALVGIYSSMVGNYSGFASGDRSISLLTGLAGDELEDYSFFDPLSQFYNNSVSSDNTILIEIWSEYYKYVYSANAIIEGIALSNNISAPAKIQLDAEAKFIRAFCYYYLINIFGDVPFITTTDYKANTLADRMPKSLMCEKIIEDLTAAKSTLSEDYINTERIRPNKFSISALLARYYSIISDWKNAEMEATEIINSSKYILEPDLNNVFLNTSKEAIWQLHPVIPGLNTSDAYVYILPFYPYWVALNPELLNNFELNDKRKTSWINSYSEDSNTWHYPYKYKIRYGANSILEYLIVFRLSEQYLIRSEARTHLNNMAGAQSDLNIIRNRAGLPNTNANVSSSLFSAIEQERQVELFTEWGHRWIDLKRTNNINSVLESKKTNWTSTDSLFPIPLSEIQQNPNLTQNAGY